MHVEEVKQGRQLANCQAKHLLSCKTRAFWPMSCLKCINGSMAQCQAKRELSDLTPPSAFASLCHRHLSTAVVINHQNHSRREWPSTAVLCHWQGSILYSKPLIRRHPSCENKNIYDAAIQRAYWRGFGIIQQTLDHATTHLTLEKFMSKWSL